MLDLVYLYLGYRLLKYIDNDASDGEYSYDLKKTNYDNQANQLLAKNLKGKLIRK